MLQKLKESGCDVVQCSRYMSYDDHEEKIPLDDEILTGEKMLELFLANDFRMSWMVTGKLYKTDLNSKYRFDTTLVIWEDYLYTRQWLFENMNCSFCIASEPKYHYLQRPDSIMHSKIDSEKMKSYYVVRDSVPTVVIETSIYRQWHEWLLCTILFTYILFTSKTDGEKESYGKWVGELKKNFSVFNKNEHLSTKQKIAMNFCAIAPHVFYGVRRLIKRNG